MTHSSEDLNFVLIDFKGGATFAGMSGMPHVSATITNLGDDLTLVDRMERMLCEAKWHAGRKCYVPVATSRTSRTTRRPARMAEPTSSRFPHSSSLPTSSPNFLLRSRGLH